jgi:PKHD-type hydroxylase
LTAPCAAVGWVQSLVRDPVRGEILFNLDVARRGLIERSGQRRGFDRISKQRFNHLRLSVEVLEAAEHR